MLREDCSLLQTGYKRNQPLPTLRQESYSITKIDILERGLQIRTSQKNLLTALKAKLVEMYTLIYSKVFGDSSPLDEEQKARIEGEVDEIVEDAANKDDGKIKQWLEASEADKDFMIQTDEHPPEPVKVNKDTDMNSVGGRPTVGLSLARKTQGEAGAKPRSMTGPKLMADDTVGTEAGSKSPAGNEQGTKAKSAAEADIGPKSGGGADNIAKSTPVVENGVDSAAGSETKAKSAPDINAKPTAGTGLGAKSVAGNEAKSSAGGEANSAAKVEAKSGVGVKNDAKSVAGTGTTTSGSPGKNVLEKGDMKK